jgi:acid phosphatase type 7
MKVMALFTSFILVSYGFSQDITVAAAGDIACPPGKEVTSESCQMMATSELILNANVKAVLALGDSQYPDGKLSDFEKSYDLSWGRFKDKTYPAIGNHEYVNLGEGYFAYFGAVASEGSQGYYSFDLGAWHIISLNSNCWAVGGCSENSPQGQWLKSDLEAHPSQCTLAFWHHPRFNSGKHGDNVEVTSFWNLLVNAKAEIVLNGHDHLYERFAPQLGDGTASENGIRQFTVGMGGRVLYRLERETPNQEFANDRNFGVLFLTLKENSYAWEFKTITGEVLDAGEGICK